MKRSARAIQIITIGFAGVSALVVLAPLNWATELTTHFRPQISLVGIALTALAAMTRQWIAALIIAALAAFHGQVLLPYLLAGEPHRAVGGEHVRILQMNVNSANRSYASVEKLIVDAAPDIVGLLEVNTDWLIALESLHDRYPHRIEHPRHDNFGIALFSRIPIDELRVRDLQLENIKAITGSFSLGEAYVTVVFAHAVPPVSAAYSKLRNRQLEQLAEIAREFDGNEKILLGDLNTSPWSPHYFRLEEVSGLRNAARGFGYSPTWPTRMRVLMIPLDHYLVSDGLRVVRFEVGPEIGSDHLPVLAEFTLSGGV